MLSSLPAKLAPVCHQNKKIQRVNVLQRLNLDALYSSSLESKMIKSWSRIICFENESDITW